MKSLVALSRFQQVVCGTRKDISTTPSELQLKLQTVSPMPSVLRECYGVEKLKMCPFLLLSCDGGTSVIGLQKG